MDPAVFGLILVAAGLHVSWNVLLKTAGDPLRAAWVGMMTGALIMVPLGFIGWLVAGRPAISGQVVLLAAISGAIEGVYFVLLSMAYRRGDLSVVYPVARGTAPLLAGFIGVAFLGERLGPVAIFGIGAVLVGLLALQRPWRSFRLVRTRAGAGLANGSGFAFGAGVMIALYSAVDRVAVRLVEPWLYAALLWLAMAISVNVIVFGSRGLFSDERASTNVDVPRAAFGGAITLAAYFLILIALSLAPLAVVAPLRESAIVLASGWGALRLGETAGWRSAASRIAAASIVLAGAILLALGR